MPPDSDTSSYGDPFNAVGGGVYAMQWTSSQIKIWHFPRTQIPNDIVAKSPQPELWGVPQAVFAGSGCHANTYFRDMKLVVQTVCSAHLPLPCCFLKVPFLIRSDTLVELLWGLCRECLGCYG